MDLILVTGGARSGKSRHAERLAADIGGDDVTFIATARPSDEEMARRIARHRAERPVAWTTVEAPRHAGDAVRDADTPVVLLDCVTLLASNALLAAAELTEEAELEAALAEDAGLAAVRRETDALLAAGAAREGTLIVVTNEVGMGLVPTSPLGRRYRDALGKANQQLADAAAEVVLMVSGIAVPIKPGRG